VVAETGAGTYSITVTAGGDITINALADAAYIAIPGTVDYTVLVNYLLSPG
jgi:hypothetical protein